MGYGTSSVLGWVGALLKNLVWRGRGRGTEGAACCHGGWVEAGRPLRHGPPAQATEEPEEAAEPWPGADAHTPLRLRASRAVSTPGWSSFAPCQCLTFLRKLLTVLSSDFPSGVKCEGLAPQGWLLYRRYSLEIGFGFKNDLHFIQVENLNIWFFLY